MGSPATGMGMVFGTDGVHPYFKNGNMINVLGPADTSGLYVQLGDNLVSGPDGVHTVFGTGTISTVFNPDGSTNFFTHLGS